MVEMGLESSCKDWKHGERNPSLGLLCRLESSCKDWKLDLVKGGDAIGDEIRIFL